MARSARVVFALFAVTALAATGCANVRARTTEQLDRIGAPFGSSLPDLAFDRPVDLLPPEGLHVASNEGREIVLAWHPVLVGDIAGYAITRARAPRGPYELIGATSSRFATLHVDSGVGEDQLGDGERYYYRVHPHDRQGQVSRSHGFVVATTEEPPTVPSGLRAYSNLPRRVVLRWEPNERAATAGYTILRSPTEAGPWEEVGEVEGRVNSLFEDPVSGDLVVMYYRVSAFNRFGGASPMTEPFRAVTKAEPLPPIELAISERTLGRVGLAWAPNVEPDLARYEVWRERGDDDSDAWSGAEKISEVAPPETRYLDTEVGCGERVRYRVRAVDADALQGSFSKNLEAVGERLGLEFVQGADGRALLRWDPTRAPGFTGARFSRGRAFGGESPIGTGIGTGTADGAGTPPDQYPLDTLPPGRHDVRVILTGEGVPDSPMCEIAVEISPPALPASPAASAEPESPAEIAPEAEGS